MLALDVALIAFAVGTSTYYWVTRGRDQQFLVGRYMTALALFLWPLFLVYFVLAAIGGRGKAR
jgi:hypothetical protein